MQRARAQARARGDVAGAEGARPRPSGAAADVGPKSGRRRSTCGPHRPPFGPNAANFNRTRPHFGRMWVTRGKGPSRLSTFVVCATCQRVLCTQRARGEGGAEARRAGHVARAGTGAWTTPQAAAEPAGVGAPPAPASGRLGLPGTRGGGGRRARRPARSRGANAMGTPPGPQRPGRGGGATDGAGRGELAQSPRRNQISTARDPI